jgi:hypothetical protein
MLVNYHRDMSQDLFSPIAVGQTLDSILEMGSCSSKGASATGSSLTPAGFFGSFGFGGAGGMHSSSSCAALDDAEEKTDPKDKKATL